MSVYPFLNKELRIWSVGHVQPFYKDHKLRKGFNFLSAEKEINRNIFHDTRVSYEIQILVLISCFIGTWPHSSHWCVGAALGLQLQMGSCDADYMTGKVGHRTEKFSLNPFRYVRTATYN